MERIAVLREYWQSFRLNGIRGWIYLNLALLLYLGSLSAFRRLIPHVGNLPEEEQLEVFALALSGCLSSAVLYSVAAERKRKGSPWPIGVLKIWLMIEPEGSKEWEYQMERLILAWKKAHAEKEIRAKREARYRGR